MLNKLEITLDNIDRILNPYQNLANIDEAHEYFSNMDYNGNYNGDYDGVRYKLFIIMYYKYLMGFKSLQEFLDKLELPLTDMYNGDSYFNMQNYLYELGYKTLQLSKKFSWQFDAFMVEDFIEIYEDQLLLTTPANDTLGIVKECLNLENFIYDLGADYLDDLNCELLCLNNPRVDACLLYADKLTNDDQQCVVLRLLLEKFSSILPYSYSRQITLDKRHYIVILIGNTTDNYTFGDYNTIPIYLPLLFHLIDMTTASIIERYNIQYGEYNYE